jgi:hypothetical protein
MKLQVRGSKGKGNWLLCQVRYCQYIGRQNVQQTIFKLAFYSAKQPQNPGTVAIMPLVCWGVFFSPLSPKTKNKQTNKNLMQRTEE